MCGRFTLRSAPALLRHAFDYPEQPNFPSRYNIAPTQPVAVVTGEANGRHFQLMRWGFIPAWVKDPKTFSLVINARSETVLDKPAFRNAIRRRRCLIPADGYYEWQSRGGRKQPFFIHPRDGAPMGLAAVAETWVGPNGEELDTVAIVTTAAREEMAHLHTRVPVVIAPRDYACWLEGGEIATPEAITLLQPPASGSLAWHPVSTEVNRVANDHAGLLEPIDPAAEIVGPEKAEASPRNVTRRAVDERQGSLF
jgi:putative SOS response-associated peptidase YedK